MGNRPSKTPIYFGTDPDKGAGPGWALSPVVMDAYDFCYSVSIDQLSLFKAKLTLCCCFDAF